MIPQLLSHLLVTKAGCSCVPIHKRDINPSINKAIINEIIIKQIYEFNMYYNPGTGSLYDPVKMYK